MKATKVTKKLVKAKEPAFIVDLTSAETPAEVFAQFGFAKQKAGLPMSDTEFNAIIEIACLTTCRDVTNSILGNIKIPVYVQPIKPEKKPNIFRRFWNWLTGRK